MKNIVVIFSLFFSSVLLNSDCRTTSLDKICCSFLGVICFSHKYISSSSLIESTFSLLEEDSTYSSSNIYNTGYDYSLNLSSELDLLPLNLVNLVEIIPLQNTVLGSP